MEISKNNILNKMHQFVYDKYINNTDALIKTLTHFVVPITYIIMVVIFYTEPLSIGVKGSHDDLFLIFIFCFATFVVAMLQDWEDGVFFLSHLMPKNLSRPNVNFKNTWENKNRKILILFSMMYFLHIILLLIMLCMYYIIVYCYKAIAFILKIIFWPLNKPIQRMSSFMGVAVSKIANTKIDFDVKTKENPAQDILKEINKNKDQ